MTVASQWTSPHLALVGTTASGKSAVAFEVARRRPDVELVSVDSMCVYRGMDVGTAKPTPAQQAEVPHHLLDLADPSEDYSVSRFQAAARHALEGIEARGHRALLVGGTGLYLHAVVDELELPGQWPEVAAKLEAEADGPGGVASLHARLADLDPVAAGRMQPTNRRRVVRALEVTLGSGRRFSSFGPGLAAYPASPASRFALVGLRLPAPTVARRVEERFLAQLDNGFLDEVRRLVRRPAGLSRTARQALGYRELLAHVEEGAPAAEATAQAIRRMRTFARRQRAWFGRDPRITWLDPVDAAGDANPLAAVPSLLGNWTLCPRSA
jgi:tRNA dimethylallyltransferase